LSVSFSVVRWVAPPSASLQAARVPSGANVGVENFVPAGPL
jgi:hypothetical protein